MKDYLIYFYLIVPIALMVTGQVSTKYGALLLTEGQAGNYFFILNIYIIIGYMCFLIRGLDWILIVRKFDLSFAYPFQSLSFVFVLFLSYSLFGEKISSAKLLGTFFIISGVITIGLSEIRKNKC